MEFCSTPVPPLSPNATELTRLDFPRQKIHSIYWRNGHAGRYRLFWSDAGTFDLDARRGRVLCHLMAKASPTSVEEVLRGPVCSFFLIEHGFEPLHAGAVVLGGRCVAFAGAPGAGKSTLIAHLAQNGARFLADDVVPMRLLRGAVRAWPGLPQLRLVPRSVRSLRWSGRLLWKTRWKATLSAATARKPFRVARVYLPERSAVTRSVSLESLSPQDAFVALVSHTRNLAETAPRRMRTQLRVCGWLANHVSVRRLSYPDGFTHLDRARRTILEDLAE